MLKENPVIIEAEPQTIKGTESRKLFLETPIDTIVSVFDDGDSLFTYIFKYYNTIPGKPIRSFITLNEKDSIVFKSFDEDLKIEGDIVEEHYSFHVSPVYTVNQTSRSLVFTIALNTIIDEGFLIASALRSDFFNAVDATDKFIIFGSISVSPTTKGFKPDDSFKSCEMDSKEVKEQFDILLSYVKNFDEGGFISIETSEALKHYFICYTNNWSSQPNKVFDSSIDVATDMEHRFELYYF